MGRPNVLTRTGRRPEHEHRDRRGENPTIRTLTSPSRGPRPSGYECTEARRSWSALIGVSATKRAHRADTPKRSRPTARLRGGQRVLSRRRMVRSSTSFGRSGRPFRRWGYCSFIASIPATLMTRTGVPWSSCRSSSNESGGKVQSAPPALHRVPLVRTLIEVGGAELDAVPGELVRLLRRLGGERVRAGRDEHVPRTRGMHSLDPELHVSMLPD